MAHSDYMCCAICDSKLEYVGVFSSVSKARICEDCLLNLQERGLPIVTVGQLVRWVQCTDRETVRTTLRSLGFRRCHFDNDVDNAARAAGLEFDEGRYVK